MPRDIYEFDVLDISGNQKLLREFAGKVILIVNTASKCGFTKQYKSLEILYNKFKDQGFEVLAFPSNDFRNQEPLKGVELESFCRIDQRTTFPVFEPIQVKGENAHPLFRFLSDKKLNGKVGRAPVWNFQKYLINRKGEVVDYYFPFTSPLSNKIETRINELLAE